MKYLRIINGAKRIQVGDKPCPSVVEGFATVTPTIVDDFVI